jgi:hypothetical protein
VAPLQRKGLLWPQPGVGKDGDERGVAQPPLVEQEGSHRLDDGGREWSHRASALRSRFADGLDRVAVDPLPLDRALKDPLEHRQGLADRVGADAFGLELGSEAGDNLRPEVPEPVAAEARKHVGVP